jgi:hypothetical protein
MRTNTIMTEDQIERAVERTTDAIDAQYMAGKLSESEYKDKLSKLDQWAEREYRFAKGAA